MNDMQEHLDSVIVGDILSPINPFSNLTCKDWQQLEQVLNRAQNDFVSKLRIDYPQLSEDDIHVAMLLRINLTHEQIAQISHVELSSFRKRRYRIKKKMGVKCLSLSQFIKELFVVQIN